MCDLQNRNIQTIVPVRITNCIFSNTSKQYMSDCKAMQFFCRLLSPDPSYLHANITGKVFMQYMMLGVEIKYANFEFYKSKFLTELRHL